MEELIILKDVALPSKILAASELAVQNGKASSINELIVNALKRELKAQRRAEIDAEFASMAEDIEYQKEALQLESEFALGQWEAWQLGELEE